MGKGDKKSKIGKLTIGSYGVNRPQRKQNKATKPEAANAVPQAVVAAPKAKAAAKKKK